MKKNLDLLFAFIVLIITTFVFYFSNLDLKISGYFYNPESHWFLKNVWWATLLYKFGTIPAILLSASGLIVFILSHFKDKIKKYRISALYLTLCMVVGPGIIINTILKDNYGRPRPRHNIEFSGDYEHQKILVPGIPGRGKSFPCGHATMGFYFFALYFLARKRRQKIFWFSFAAIFGSLIGFVRVVQGGHFTSDVIWAGVLIYLVSRGFYKLLNIEKNFYWDEHHEDFFTIHKRKILYISYFIVPLGIIAFLFTSPNHSLKKMIISKEKIAKVSYADYDFSVVKTNFTIDFADSLLFVQESQGFGFPNSRLKRKYQKEFASDSLLINYRTYVKGYFSELNSTLDAFIPVSISSQGRIKLKDSMLRYSEVDWRKVELKNDHYKIISRDSLHHFEIILENSKIYGAKAE